MAQILFLFGSGRLFFAAFTWCNVIVIFARDALSFRGCAFHLSLGSDTVLHERIVAQVLDIVYRLCFQVVTD